MSQRAGLVLGSALDQPLFHSAQGVEARALGQAIGGVGLISHHSVQCRLVWIWDPKALPLGPTLIPHMHLSVPKPRHYHR